MTDECLMAVTASRADRTRRPQRPALSSGGDQLEACYASLRRALQAFLTRRTQSIEDAEDLTQEVFLRLWRLQSASQIRSLEAFLFKAASNLLTDRRRRAHMRMMRGSIEITQLELTDSGADPRQALECQQTVAAFESVLGSLRQPTRSAFLSFMLNGSPHSEIARQMGISVSMVEKHVSTAIKALRRAGVGATAEAQ